MNKKTHWHAYERWDGELEGSVYCPACVDDLDHERDECELVPLRYIDPIKTCAGCGKWANDWITTKDRKEALFWAVGIALWSSVVAYLLWIFFNN